MTQIYSGMREMSHSPYFTKKAKHDPGKIEHAKSQMPEPLGLTSKEIGFD